jgi:TPR repeat protein
VRALGLLVLAAGAGAACLAASRLERRARPAAAEPPPLAGTRPAGAADARTPLALAYAFGLGGPRDRARAAAATLETDGAAAGATFLWYGDVFARGQHGVAVDPGEARAWYRLAAEQGHPEAQQRLETFRG